MRSLAFNFVRRVIRFVDDLGWRLTGLPRDDADKYTRDHDGPDPT